MKIDKDLVIPTPQEALAHLRDQIQEHQSKLANAEEVAGEFAEEDLQLAVDKVSAASDPIAISAISEKEWLLVSVFNLRETIERLKGSLEKDLITPYGNYLLLPKGESLISPAGFHPDNLVFIKPSSGAIVDRLPKTSNMAYFDFTGNNS